MSEQRDLTPDDRAERDKLVSTLRAATDVVRQAKVAMGDANAEIDRLRADLAAERERAERAETQAAEIRKASQLLVSEAEQDTRAAEQRAAQAEAGAAVMRAALADARRWIAGEPICTPDDILRRIDITLADPAGRELLAAADELAGVAKKVQEQRRHDMSGAGCLTCDAIAALVHWSAVRGQM